MKTKSRLRAGSSICFAHHHYSYMGCQLRAVTAWTRAVAWSCVWISRSSCSVMHSSWRRHRHHWYACCQTYFGDFPICVLDGPRKCSGSGSYVYPVQLFCNRHKICYPAMRVLAKTPFAFPGFDLILPSLRLAGWRCPVSSHEMDCTWFQTTITAIGHVYYYY